MTSSTKFRRLNTDFTNFWNESDLIKIADVITATPGDDNIIHSTNGGTAIDPLTDGGHSMSAYLKTMQVLSSIGVSYDDITSGVLDIDNIYVSLVDSGGPYFFVTDQVVKKIIDNGLVAINDILIGGNAIGIDANGEEVFDADIFTTNCN